MNLASYRSNSLDPPPSHSTMESPRSSANTSLHQAPECPSEATLKDQQHALQQNLVSFLRSAARSPPTLASPTPLSTISKENTFIARVQARRRYLFEERQSKADTRTTVRYIDLEEWSIDLALFFNGIPGEEGLPLGGFENFVVYLKEGNRGLYGAFGVK
ncbi:hypothetical protein T440DRAFT_519779 [Plenodomus tracheiphilus IPT5]|uniref:Uncharacterized protein n=1 Tax=Plenodomus tracheiphilus IPT5 TaxID=1408161 RepID=A0A6A7AZQ7_9PLEO|nr:hypothetical protein T440DRAFT_519779 [Plenodomus tracheiphilus IPT5]